MSDIIIESTDPNNTISIPPILRSLEIAETTVAGVKLGSTAVRDQVKLGIFIFDKNFLEPNAQNNPYQGEIAIEHTVSDHEQADDETQLDQNTQNVSADENSIEDLKHKYIGHEPLENTEEDRGNPYIRKNPWLAPN